MRYRRCHFLPSHERQIIEQRICKCTPDFRKDVAVEEKERGAPVTRPEKFNRFSESQLPQADFFPLSRSRFVSFSPNARLRSASRSESSVDLGER